LGRQLLNAEAEEKGVDELFRRLTDALVETLQESIEKDAETV